MAKEAIEKQKGQTLDITLTEDVSVGDVIPLGTGMVGIATVSGLTGEVIAVEVEKVWTINATTANEINVGDEVFFNATAREITTTATDNTRAGRAVSAKAAATPGTVDVKINAA